MHCASLTVASFLWQQWAGSTDWVGGGVTKQPRMLLFSFIWTEIHHDNRHSIMLGGGKRVKCIFYTIVNSVYL